MLVAFTANAQYFDLLNIQTKEDIISAKKDGVLKKTYQVQRGDGALTPEKVEFFNKDGRLNRIVYANKRQWFDYNELGQLVKITDSIGAYRFQVKMTTVVYDEYDKPKEIKYNNIAHSYSYNPETKVMTENCKKGLENDYSATYTYLAENDKKLVSYVKVDTSYKLINKRGLIYNNFGDMVGEMFVTPLQDDFENKLGNMYLYNNKGQLLEKTSIYIKAKEGKNDTLHTDVTAYVYDFKGLLQKQTTKSSNPNYHTASNYTYNAKGQMIEFTTIDQNGVVILRQKMSYN